MVSALFLAATLAALAAPTEADLRAVAALPGEPSVVAAAGLTKDDAPILTLENRSAFDAASTKRRVVLFGTSDAAAAVVIATARWFKTDPAAAALRQQAELSVLPLAAFDLADSKGAAITRWMMFQAPDAIVELDDDGAHPIGPGDVLVHNWVSRLPATPETIGSTLRTAVSGGVPSAGVDRSPHDIMRARVSRDPIAIATLLAKKYPEQPAISYIPSVAWTNTLKLAALTNDQALAEKVRAQTAPWVTRAQPLFGNRIQLTSVAGTMVFADLGGEALPLALEGAKLAASRKADGIAEYGQGWTDDMFMASAILARVGRLPDQGGLLDAAATLLVEYSARLQRPDGVFIHATEGPFAWGRGNGFAALGLAETLAVLPERHPQREKLLDIFRRQMNAVKTHQSPDGMWREVIDEPGAYREETATAMLLTAMARGIRMGWIDKTFTSSVERGWLGLSAHVREDGTLIDVCTGTGSGPTRRYYLDRAAITGADDRGGAMALLAAMEMREFRGR
jgi:unsaturated rhamnogalacturonyl hydrolase